MKTWVIMNAGCRYLAVIRISFSRVFNVYLYDPKLGIYNINNITKPR